MAMPANAVTTVPQPGSTAFRLDAASLCAAIDACLPFVPRRPFRPILSSMLLRAVDGRVCLCATDLEAGTSVEVDGTGQGALCLPAAVRAALPKAGAVEVTAEGPVAVRCGQMTLQSFDAEQFPEIPAPDGAAGSPVPSAEFLHILTRAATCASTEETGRALLRCVSATADGRLLGPEGFHVYVHHAPSATGAGLGDPGQRACHLHRPSQ